MSQDESHASKLQGVVVSCKMQNTIVVLVEDLKRHPHYKKFVKRYRKLYVHDEKGVACLGDRVFVQAHRPISKTKHWILISVEQKA